MGGWVKGGGGGPPVLAGTRKYKQSDQGWYQAEGGYDVMEFGMSCRIKPKRNKFAFQ